MSGRNIDDNELANLSGGTKPNDDSRPGPGLDNPPGGDVGQNTEGSGGPNEDINQT